MRAVKKAITIRPTMTIPCQKAEKLPATIPEIMFREAPASRLALTISSTCFDFEEVKILVNSGISAAASVPQEIITESFHHRSAPMSPIIT